MLSDIIRNHTPITSNMERLSLLFKSAINAYKYPTQADHLSHLGELGGYYCLQNIHKRMLEHNTGRRILAEKPRVTPETFPVDKLLQMDPNTFGYHYGKFMGDRFFSSAERPLVKYIPDLELAYVYQRYKEIHDFIHVLLIYDVSVYDEIVVKWFEMAQLGLPSTTLSAFVGALKLKCEERQRLLSELPVILSKAKRGEFLMNVYFEEHLNDDLLEMKRSLRLI